MYLWTTSHSIIPITNQPARSSMALSTSRVYDGRPRKRGVDVAAYRLALVIVIGIQYNKGSASVSGVYQLTVVGRPLRHVSPVRSPRSASPIRSVRQKSKRDNTVIPCGGGRFKRESKTLPVPIHMANIVFVSYEPC